MVSRCDAIPGPVSEAEPANAVEGMEEAKDALEAAGFALDDVSAWEQFWLNLIREYEEVSRELGLPLDTLRVSMQVRREEGIEG